MRNFIYKIPLILFVVSTALLVSCSDDEKAINPFVVSFENKSESLTGFDSEKEVNLVYSRVVAEESDFTISITSTSAVYGVDFITVPAAENNQLTLPLVVGQEASTFTFKKIVGGSLDESTEVSFEVTNINHQDGTIQGNSTFVFNSSASLGGSLAPEVGGPNEPNQVYVDLSGNSSKAVQRDTWDLGFYTGDEYRVVLNGSLYMAAGEIDATDIDAVTGADVTDLKTKVAVGTFDPANEGYIDNPSGDINDTAITEINVTADENKVYLLNMGAEIGTETPAVGSVAVSGASRGWKKIRILRDGANYKLQYANLDDITHKEVTITKDGTANFNFFSIINETETVVEPPKEKWDMCFSVFTNVIPGAGSYGYSDFVFHNRKGGAVAYMVDPADASITYDDFKTANVDNAQFSENQTVIGSGWRDVFTKTVKDVYYILKDSNNNIYKIKFTALTNEDGVRGNPKFKYELLN